MVVHSYADAARRPAPRLGWAVPLIPAAVSGFCLSALVYYHVEFGGAAPGRGWVQALVVGLYRLLGFVPAVMMALLAFVWSTIWYVSGKVDRPWRRGLRILALTVALSILVGMQPGAGEDLRGGGLLGSFLAVRLESAVGYVAGTLLGAGAVLFALLLATDLMFYRYFEPLAQGHAVPRRRAEDGVEAEAVQDMKALRLEGGFGSATALAGAPRSARAAAADETDDDGTDDDAASGGVEGPDYRGSWRERVAVAAAEDAEALLDESEVEDGDDLMAEAADAELDDGDDGDEDEDEEYGEDEEYEDEEELEYEDDDEEDGEDGEDDDSEEDELDGIELAATEDEDEEPDDLAIGRLGEDDGDLGIDEEALARLDRGLAALEDADDGEEAGEGEGEDDDDEATALDAGLASRQGELFEARVADVELIAEATDLVRAAGRGTVTLLQRRLRIGYEEAQDLLDALRRQGVVDGEAGEPQGRVRGAAEQPGS